MLEVEQKLKVYLETSFMFYLTGRETTDAKVAADQAFTRKWWSVEGPKCELFTSPFVIVESNDRDPEYVEKRNEKIAQTRLLQLELQALGQSPHLSKDQEDCRVIRDSMSAHINAEKLPGGLLR